MGDAVLQSGVLSSYRSSLEPVYEEICGDTATYTGVETQFTGYLEQLTEPPENIAQAFRDFLDYGRNCHEGSTAARSSAYTQGLVTDLRPAVSSAVNGASLYAPFRIFRRSYIELIDIIHSLNNAEFIKVGGDQGTWQVDRTAIMRMWRTANDAHTLSANILLDIAKKLFELRANDFETAVIRAQHAMLLKLNVTVFEFAQAMDPAQSYDFKPVVDRIDTFEKVHAELMNPLNWAARLFREVMRLVGHQMPKGSGVMIHSAHRELPLKHETPAVLMELMERMFFIIARTGTSLDISIESSGGRAPRYDLVISSGHSLVTLRADLSIANLAHLLGATWDTPGLFSSIFTRPFQTLRGRRHRIMIPLQISGISQRTTGGSGPKITVLSPPATPDPAQAATILQAQGMNGALLMAGSRLGLLPTMPVIPCAPLTITR